MFKIVTLVITFIFAVSMAQHANAEKLWVNYSGGEGPGKGKHIVLVSGDDEYRSEEGLPQLGKILSVRHGFKCTVLFPIDPTTGEIKPDYQKNIPGLEVLAEADLMIIATRYRDLPDEQMKHFETYLKAGKPIIGLRTATHAFQIRSSETYKHWSNTQKDGGFDGGFGRQILGETWIAHHGAHGRESTRGVITEDAAAENHPIVRGITPGSIWGDSDVYTVRLPLPGDSRPLVLGAVLTGMSPTDPPVKNKKNDPMMPLAWTKTYRLEGGEKGLVFTSTLGAATDIVAEGSRRMIVNAAYWALGMGDKVKPEGSDVRLVGEFKPTPFGFGNFRKGVKPADHELK